MSVFEDELEQLPPPTLADAARPRRRRNPVAATISTESVIVRSAKERRSIEAVALLALTIVLGGILGVSGMISVRTSDLDPLMEAAQSPIVLLIVGGMLSLLGIRSKDGQA